MEAKGLSELQKILDDSDPFLPGSAIMSTGRVTRAVALCTSCGILAPPGGKPFPNKQRAFAFAVKHCEEEHGSRSTS